MSCYMWSAQNTAGKQKLIPLEISHLLNGVMIYALLSPQGLSKDQIRKCK